MYHYIILRVLSWHLIGHFSKKNVEKWTACILKLTFDNQYFSVTEKRSSKLDRVKWRLVYNLENGYEVFTWVSVVTPSLLPWNWSPLIPRACWRVLDLSRAKSLRGWMLGAAMVCQQCGLVISTKKETWWQLLLWRCGTSMSTDILSYHLQTLDIFIRVF